LFFETVHLVEHSETPKMAEGVKLKAIYASSLKTTRGRPTVIKADPKGKKLLYANGTSIFIRDIENPAQCEIYTEHSKETTVASYAPSGNYIASGDISGKVRIWDALGSEHILKYEYQVLGGAVKDIVWTEDSKRIVAGGEGKDKFAHAFMWDTGTSVGNISAISKTVNNVDIKQNRPYRVVASSEDFVSYFYEGPPFKFKSQLKEHTNFVNCARYAPDGSVFATAGADGKCFIYDGKTGSFVGQMNDSEGRIHKGGVYGICFSPDSKQLLTVSADKTAKIWNVEKRLLDVEFKFPDTLENQQIGCVWTGKNIITVSLDGNLNYLEKDDPSAPAKVIQGHNKAIMALAVTEDGESVFSASYDGLIYHWNVQSGIGVRIKGKPHMNQINSMNVFGNYLVSCGMDDTVRYVNVPGNEFLENYVGMDSQPKALSSGKDGLVVVACIKEIVVIRNHRVVHKEVVDYEPNAIALSPDESVVAIGCAGSHPLVSYDIEDDVLKNKKECGGNGSVTCLRFSRDGANLIVTDALKTVRLFKPHSQGGFREAKTWTYHAAKVNNAAFSPNGRLMATCSVDTYVHIWDLEAGYIIHKLKAVHGMAVNVTCVEWLNDNTLVTAGQQDCSIRLWHVPN